jgi:Asp-tRNA(Asn)/Glu-tRNA(Gln) amidotransferase A subunit family amidase
VTADLSSAEAIPLKTVEWPALPARAGALREGRTAPEEDVDRLENEFARVERLLSAFLPETGRFARLRNEAAELISRLPDPSQRGPLFGIPVGVKDIFHVRGFPTGAGSRLPPEELAGEEGDAVERLRRSHALFLGKTVSTEFAYFAPGPTRNPRNPAHTPGGSSSGSAAAVAAGLTPLALGTQTIGSVIRPAAFCGVVGFKPSRERIPTTGVIPLSPTLDQIGFFTIDVESAAYAAPALLSAWSPTSPSRPPTLAVPAGPYLEKAGGAALEQFRNVVRGLAAAGYSTREVAALLDFEAVAGRHQLILAAEAAKVHAVWFSRHAGRYHPRTAELIQRGQQIGSAALERACREAAEWREELREMMDEEGIDLWVCPSAPGTAPSGLESTGDPVMNLPWTQAGFPVLTIPSGKDSAGLPYGLQIVARPGDDEKLLDWARGLERAIGHGR